ncbi:MFS transporter [Saccharomonospora azurea]|uniref:MFS transporter n=1 Tax=Saccharomonospora azurea TaxID=40988 RepID=UPI0002400D5B|nr:arabinose efflux permease family protein [Saccharomonospora azurea SZMC 14600]
MSDVPASPLRHRPFVLMLSAAVGAFAGFALLLPVVPLWTVRQGAGSVIAGASTGVFMASTVLAQFAVPAFVRAFGYRAGLVLGALLIGVPTPLLAVFPSAGAILATSFVRGLGFGLLTVCASALIAELLPSESVARGSGLYGLAVGVPQLVGLPAGTAIAENWGFVPVFVLATVLPLVAILPIAGLPRSRPRDTARGGLRGAVDVAAATWRPWLPMLAVSTGYGALATFLPIVLSPSVAAAALLVVPGAAMFTRWLAGHYGDRVAAPGRMLLPALAVGGAGLLGFALVSETDGLAAVAVVAVALFGVGFGVVQNDALVAMFARAPAAQASVAWNVAFDAGQGLGAVALGALISGTTVATGFTLLAVAALAVLPVAWQAGRTTPRNG